MGGGFGFSLKSTLSAPHGDLPWISGSSSFLKRSIYSSKTHPRPAWHGEASLPQMVSDRKTKWENSGGTKEGSEWPQASDPLILSEKRETQTQGTPFFLYEEIQSGHIVWKNLSKLVSTFPRPPHLQDSELQSNWVASLHTATTQHRPWTSSDLKHNVTLNICEATTDDVNSGPWTPCCQTGWIVTHDIQVQFIHHWFTHTLFPYLSESQRGLWEEKICS